MGPRDLARRDLVIVTDVGRRVATPVLELDCEPHSKLLDIEPCAIPINPDPLADLARFLVRELTVLFHGRSVPCLATRMARSCPMQLRTVPRMATVWRAAPEIERSQ